MFTDLGLAPQTTLGASASPVHIDKLVFDNSRDELTELERAAAKIEVTSPAFYFKGPGAWQTPDFLKALHKLRVKDVESNDIYKVASVLGKGSFGIVVEFRSPTSSHSIAVKILLGTSPHTRPHIPDSIKCNVVESAVFLNGRLQIMELGVSALEEVVPDIRLIDKFDHFCNETAECFLRNKLVCTDWKLDNLTLFFDSEQDWINRRIKYRVIDIDGIANEASDDAVLTRTFYFTAMADGPEDVMGRIINTAAAIEFSKAYFALQSAADRKTIGTLFAHNSKTNVSVKATLAVIDADAEAAAHLPGLIAMLRKIQHIHSIEVLRSALINWFAREAQLYTDDKTARAMTVTSQESAKRWNDVFGLPDPDASPEEWIDHYNL